MAHFITFLARVHDLSNNFSHLAMKQVQDAAKLLARRYDQSSLKTAAHISMIANDKQQGLMYTQKVVQQHLLQNEWKDTYSYLKEQKGLQVNTAPCCQSLRTRNPYIKHFDNTPMQYTAIFNCCKNGNFQVNNCDSFLIFAQNIDSGYTLEPPREAVLTSTHNLCFNAKIRKIMYTPVNPSFTI